MPSAVAEKKGLAVGVRIQNVSEFEKRYGMEEPNSLENDAPTFRALIT